ncbi:BTB/POZ domain-containing protein [Rhizophagus clarus]|nr:BTB/POZ domain-containing protein [Rhizophagus clarus]
MFAFYLAEKYKLSFLFEETSKLVLDQLPKYKEDSAFQKLPLEIQSALIARHMSYVHSVAELSVNHFLSTYRHTCNNPAFHNKELNQEIESRVSTILDQPNNIKPSKVWSIILSHITVTDGIDCNDYFMREHLAKKFTAMFGDFKCLDIDKDEENPKCYIYISRNKS